MPNPEGRPLKFKPKELKKLILDTFKKWDKAGTPYTITGLALALKTTRDLLCDYAKKPEFSDTIGWAKLKVENYCEVNALLGNINPSIGQFVLKNHGWKDKSEVEQTGGNTVTIIRPEPRKRKTK